MPDLTKLPDCSDPETPCTPPAVVAEAQLLMVIDLVSECVKQLQGFDGGSLAVSVDGEVKNRTGSETSQIILEKLRVIKGSFSHLMVTDNAGSLARVEALNKCFKSILVAKDGKYDFERLENSTCWDDICEDTPIQFAGWVTAKDCEGETQYCIRRFSLVGSNCLSIKGTGSATDPLVLAPIISPNSGNQLECLNNGLFVGAIYSNDPLLL